MQPIADARPTQDPFRDRVLSLLRAHLAGLVERYGVRHLALFGSVARGEATDESDVDLVVEFDPQRVTLTSFLDFAEEVEALLGRRVDIVSLAKLPPRLRARVEAEALRVA